MTYKTFDIATAAASYEIDVFNKTMVVVKVKTSRWLLVEQDGTVYASKNAEQKILDIAARLEVRRSKGNLNGFRFGSKIDAATVESYIDEAWKGTLELISADFDGHYWWGTFRNAETGEVSQIVRADYTANYMRVPEGLESDSVVARAAEMGARF